MELHHIALGAADVERVAGFYREFFGLRELTRHHYEDQRLRSIWLAAGEVVLMVEHSEEQRPRVEGVGAGLFLLAISVSEEERARLEQKLEKAGTPIEERTGFTSYVRDPEGNRVAFSHYPTGNATGF